MDYRERFLLMECPPLGKVINILSATVNVDYPSIDIFPTSIVENSENLINVVLNAESYIDELDDFINHIESLDLLEDFNEAIIMIKDNKDLFSFTLSDIKILTKTGLTGLVFRH